MEKIHTADDLKEAIFQLEQKQAREWADLKRQTNVAFEGANPTDMFKHVFSDMITLPEPRQNEVWSTVLSTFLGYVAKRLVVRKSENPMTHMVGTVVQFGVMNLVSNNADVIKLAGMRLFDLLAHEKEKEDEE